jgi:hypothetical protein
MRARYLVVDLGAVVCQFDHGRRLDRLAQACAMGPDEIHALLWLSGFSADCDRGDYNSAAAARPPGHRVTGHRYGPVDRPGHRSPVGPRSPVPLGRPLCRWNCICR